MYDLIVVGGGIGGLAAAWAARRRGWRVALLEATPRLGGVIRTAVEDGCVLEHGPDSLLAIKPAALELIAELGLAERVVAIPEAARRSFIVHRGRLEPVPEGLYLLAPGRLAPFLASPLVSWPGKLRMLADLVLPRRRPDAPEESLAAFVRRRLGREALDALAQPLVAGIYTADPERLSLSATMPQFLAMEREHGSLIRALAARRGEGAAGPRYGLFVSLAGGLGTLVAALAARLAEGAELRCGSAARALRRDGAQWRVETDAGALTARRALLALPAPAAAALVEEPLAAALRAIPYAGVAIVHAAFERAPPLPAGAGFVVPEREQRFIIAATFAHAKYPDRAPPGWALLRAFVGGARHEARALLPDDELAAAVIADLAACLGPLPAPRRVWIQRWPQAMAQYTLGHRERVRRIRALTPPGLALVGNGYEGVGIPDVIAAARRAVEALA